MRVLGIDHGAKRIGLAISDPENHIALPECVLESRGLAKDVTAIGELIMSKEVDRVVVGLPRHMDGTLGEQAKAAQAFADALAEACAVKVEVLDERWSTVEAQRALRADGKRGRARAKQRKAVVDAVAASLILRTYLDLCRNRGELDATTSPEAEPS